VTGKWKRKFFKTKAEAKTYRDLKAARYWKLCLAGVRQNKIIPRAATTF
jgi:hypothetical protein